MTHQRIKGSPIWRKWHVVVVAIFLLMAGIRVLLGPLPTDGVTAGCGSSREENATFWRLKLNVGMLDQAWQPILNATVTITGPLNVTGFTDDWGHYELVDPPIGNYTITVNKRGFNPLTKTCEVQELERFSPLGHPVTGRRVYYADFFLSGQKVKMVVNNDSTFVDEAGRFHVVGTVRNTGESTIEFVWIHSIFWIYNETAVRLHEQPSPYITIIGPTAIIRSLTPNQTAPFEIILSNSTKLEKEYTIWVSYG